MFFGRYDYAIDAKGRLNFPAKFRDAIRSLTAQLNAREKSVNVPPPERIESWFHPEGGIFDA